MAHIDYYFSTLSPYAYLAGTRAEDVAAKHGATMSYKPLDLMGLFARTGGTPLKDRHPSRQEYRHQEILRQSKALGMPFNINPAYWPVNPAPSSYAIIGAQVAGGGDLGALVHAVLRASWAEEKDISDDAVIKACLEEAGFNPDITDRGLLSGAETYAANLEEAVANGVFGSPFYIVDGSERFWGQDRIADMDTYLVDRS